MKSRSFPKQSSQYRAYCCYLANQYVSFIGQNIQTYEATSQSRKWSPLLEKWNFHFFKGGKLIVYFNVNRSNYINLSFGKLGTLTTYDSVLNGWIEYRRKGITHPHVYNGNESKSLILSSQCYSMHRYTLMFLTVSDFFIWNALSSSKYFLSEEDGSPSLHFL